MPLIDADSLWKTFENAGWWDNADRDVAQDLLDQAPTVDAEPVKHAYWLPWNVNCNQSIEFQCAGLDGCGCYVSYDHYTQFCDYEFCPHCGAKMDAKEGTTMSDLISRSALMNYALNQVGRTIDCNDIARFPAEPVVRHGRWEVFYENLQEQLSGCQCSVCGYTFFGRISDSYNFCPRCGAKMDGDKYDANN